MFSNNDGLQKSKQKGSLQASKIGGAMKKIGEPSMDMDAAVWARKSCEH